jgi:hypothetical protein
MSAIESILPIVVFTVMSIALVVFLWRAIRDTIHPPPGPIMVCAHCGTQDHAKKYTRGSTSIELVLWLAGIVPGLIYSLWRLSSRTWSCPACGSTQLLPPNTPMAKAIAKQAAQH